MFNKKNTMILTIVAVATLLVAVVGATFAYFSTGIGGSSTTKATVTTATPGSIIISGGNKTLTLKVSVSDMSPTNQGQKYYALDTTGTGESNHGVAGTSQMYSIAKASVENGGEGVTYSCGYTVTVTSTSGMTGLTEGDLVLELEAKDIGGEGANTKTIDLANLTSSSSASGTFSLTGPNGTSEIKAGLYLENKNDNGGQNNLQGQSGTYTISIQGGDCTLLAQD